MHRRLLLMRHAKSAWSSDAPTDHARPLNDRGRFEAPRVAADLLDRGWIPDLVLSSDATRAIETWRGMVDVLGDRPLVLSRRLYHAGVEAFEEEVGLVAPQVGTLLVLGHNPGWEEVAAWLTGRSVQFTTANVALMSGRGGSWAEALKPRAWTLDDVIRPKEL